MPKTDPLVIRYSSGRGKNLGKTKEHALPIERFIDLFREHAPEQVMEAYCTMEPAM